MKSSGQSVDQRVNGFIVGLNAAERVSHIGMRHSLQEAFCTSSWASERREGQSFSEKVEEAERAPWREGSKAA